MSAPPLPESFGNYALGEFAEVVAPQAVSWLPQTTGWWWLGAALLGVALHQCWQRLRHWYRNRYRREAAVRLQQLPVAGAADKLAGEANKLLKLAAMAAYSREEVARLSGEEWVDFLNRQCRTPSFSADQLRLLAVGAYSAQALDQAAGQALISACVNWVFEHRGPDDV